MPTLVRQLKTVAIVVVVNVIDVNVVDVNVANVVVVNVIFLPSFCCCCYFLLSCCENFHSKTESIIFSQACKFFL